ncbi:dihydrodipicolinate synthase family protein [Roseibium litorale]|uniref:Dihydrodipicolinate synthase family protein n=1 Tax=Roseibium litorale TaxID=2803841 RepID=A0ABR9CMS7_9HYPH|nr:dihydrodipicolinate synthase family protein [Roseibium litorale]MBD8892178.1 dihydrodipicolinate synthase family protein [Roseibium litorale]
MPHALTGIFPVVITPFHDDDTIDWDGYEALLEWYVAKGASGLFAVCQSSEMQYLSLQERRDLARFTVDKIAGRIPVVASGHVSASEDDQKAELRAAADAGVDAVVLVTNRLDQDQTGGSTLTDAITQLLGALPSDLPLGLYECPAPYRRLLTDDELTFCAQSGRFAFLKDVSCDLDTVKHRLDLTRGTPLAINNANAAIAWPAIQAGGHGFSGVMNNFHPDLYRWLMDHGANHPDLADELNTFLVLAAMSEPMGYPKLAKEYHRRIGTFKSTHSRTVPFDIFDRFWGLSPILDQVMTGADRFRARIAAL